MRVPFSFSKIQEGGVYLSLFKQGHCVVEMMFVKYMLAEKSFLRPANRSLPKPVFSFSAVPLSVCRWAFVVVLSWKPTMMNHTCACDFSNSQFW